MSGFYVNGTNITTLFKTGTDSASTNGGFRINNVDVKSTKKATSGEQSAIQTYFRILNSDLNTIFRDNNFTENVITNLNNIESTGAAAFSYIQMPGGSRTLLNYIASFNFNGTPVTGTSQNTGTGLWLSSFSGNIPYAASPITNVNYFTVHNRVRIIDGDGTYNDGPDWAVFNFGRASTGDFDGNAYRDAYFGGEQSYSGGTGNVANYGYVWGFSSTSGWNLLYQLTLGESSGTAYNHTNGGWFSSGQGLGGPIVTSGPGKRIKYDNLLITHIGFSVR